MRYGYGNPISISMDDKEKYDDILPIYKLTPENPRDIKMLRQFERVEHRPKYTLPFKAEEVDKLYSMRNGKCNLVIYDELKGNMAPVSVDDIENFKQDIDTIWEIRRRAMAGDRLKTAA
jgi:hypothetical protein